MAPLRPKHFGPNHAVATATTVAALCESRRWKVSFLCFAIWFQAGNGTSTSTISIIFFYLFIDYVPSKTE